MTANEDVALRPARETDLATVLALYRAAFPDEDLTALVEKLSACVEAQNYVATKKDAIVGHIAFSDCRFETDERRPSLLGPLAVNPNHARRGVGSQLIRMGIDAMRARGRDVILVLGDPNYYSRFGFAVDRGVLPPYPLPAAWSDAWQSLWLTGAGATVPTALVVPKPWASPVLWQ